MEKLKTIDVRTHKTGYFPKVNGREYMYYNLQDLCAGFIKHVQEGIEPYIDEHYIKVLEDKVEEMRNLYERTLTEKRLAERERINEYNKRIKDGVEKNDLKKKVEKLEVQLRKMQEAVELADRRVKEYKKKNTDLRAKRKSLIEKLQGFVKQTN